MSSFGVTSEAPGDKHPKLEKLDDDKVSLNRGGREEELVRAATQLAHQLAAEFWPGKDTTITISGAADPQPGDPPGESLNVSISHKLDDETARRMEIEARAAQLAEQQRQEQPQSIVAHTTEFERGAPIGDTAAPQPRP